VITLGIDTMVKDNDDAKKREGCEPTYKRKKGFQPVHVYWGPNLIDAISRVGSAHSNHGPIILTQKPSSHYHMKEELMS